MSSSLTANERQQKIAQICLRLLARREHSQKEIVQKLQLRGFQVQEVEPVLADFVKRNWQDDVRYTDSFVRQRLSSGYGPMRIHYDLQQRGIQNVDLDALADQYVEGWQQLLYTVYQSKFDDQTVLSQKEWLKRCRFLLQRGFSHDMINALRTELKIQLSYANTKKVRSA